MNLNVLLFVGLFTLLIQLATSTGIRANSIPGKKFQLQASNSTFQNYRIRHSAFKLVLDKNDGTGLFEKDSIFLAVPGLTGEGISFQSVNYPKRYIRHGLNGQQCVLEEDDGSAEFKLNATFTPRNGLASGLGVSFQASFNHTFYLRHKDFKLTISQKVFHHQFYYDATFYALPAALSHVDQSGQSDLPSRLSPDADGPPKPKPPGPPTNNEDLMEEFPVHEENLNE